MPNPANLNAALAAERARALIRRSAERDAAIRNRLHDMRAALNRALTAAIMVGLLLVCASLLHFGLPATPAATLWSLILAGIAAATALSAAWNLIEAALSLFKWIALRRA
jgi:ABC-type transport system involved in cytochrome bd biosynthesis fused ATPase/permease subunit